MENEDATAGKTGVPPHRLAVLHDVILILTAIVADKICPTLFCQSRHISYRGCLVQYYRNKPPHQPAFVGRIAWRQVTVAIVVAIVHKIPIIHSFSTTIVKIGKSEAMLQVFTHPPLVRPYQIRARTVVHAITGIYDEQLVDVAIVIPVVETPVNVTLQEFLHNILDEIL